MSGYAYHSGTILNGNAPASNPEDCLHQCNTTPDCKFWDFQMTWSGGICRLHSKEGNGPQEAKSYYGGPKYCSFTGTFVIRTFAQFITLSVKPVEYI